MDLSGIPVEPFLSVFLSYWNNFLEGNLLHSLTYVMGTYVCNPLFIYAAYQTVLLFFISKFAYPLLMWCTRAHFSRSIHEAVVSHDRPIIRLIDRSVNVSFNITFFFHYCYCLLTWHSIRQSCAWIHYHFS